MPTFINKTMMVLLLCLIFIGQSMASMSMFYNMTAMQSGMQSMAAMASMKDMHHMMEESDGSVHDMSDMNTMSTEDCCAQECDCLTSSCSTVSAFSAIINTPPAFAIEKKITSPNALTASQTLTSLYRPPILS